MSVAGKRSVHYIKQDLASQKTPAIGFKNLRFAHKASAGDSLINLAALTLPTEDHYASFVNPSLSELSEARLLFNKSNLVLISSLSGILNSASYKVVGNLSIQLLEPAADGEIFEGIIVAAPRSGVQMIDANPIVVTGTLAANDDEFIVGSPFRVNKYPSQQQGEVLVFLDGQLLKRNVGNATASPTANGNYEEVDAGGGVGNSVKFNVTAEVDREVTIVSNGLAFAAPNESMFAAIESLAGQIDAMIPVLAYATGVDESEFQAAPNNVDLKAFGDRVKEVEDEVATFDGRLDDLEDPTQMSDAMATKMGHKQYVHGINYNGGNSPTVALTAGGGSIISVFRSRFVPYQLQDGGWRLRFNISVQVSGAVRTTTTFSINGISWQGSAQSHATVTAFADNGGTPFNGVQALVLTNNNTIEISHASAASQFYYASGDVELNAKPTWAY